MTLVALVLASVALAVGLVAAGLSLFVMRQSGAVATDLRQHRNAHVARISDADRRQVNLGPPRAIGERRASPGQLLPPEDSPPADLAPEDAPTGAMPRVLPRPGEIGRPR